MVRTSSPRSSITANLTSARSERSKPTTVSSFTPSPFGEKRKGSTENLRTTGSSLFNLCVTKKAAIVAATSRP